MNKCLKKGDGRSYCHLYTISIHSFP